MKWVNKKEFGERKFIVEEYQENEEETNDNKKQVILLLTMNDKENRFNPDNIKLIYEALDYIESIDNVSCLITTSSDPKYYSLGLDLDYVKPLGKSSFLELLYDLCVLIKRLLLLAIPTISCINGHSYAGGAIFSLAHDYRVMNDCKGFICVNAIDNKIPLPPGLISILKCKISNSITYRDFTLAGKRYGGLVAEKLQLVDIATPNYLLESIKLAKQIGGKDRLTYGSLKYESYKTVAETLLNNDLGESLKLKMFDDNDDDQ